MKLENDVEDLNLDFSDRRIDKPKAFQNLVYEFRLNGDSSGASSLESLDFGYDDGYIFDHQLDFPAIRIQKEEPEVTNITDKDQTVTSEVEKEKEDNKTENEVIETPAVDTGTSDARRNDREEIRKKLAMGFDDDDDYDNDNDNDEEETSVYKKPTLQSRLQSGMNLQICFMNESPADTDSELSRSPQQFEEHDNIKIAAKAVDIVDSDNNLPSVADLNRVKLDPNDRGEASNTTRLKSDVDEKEGKGFQSRQEQLQNEAKLALAQAGTMAHMQLEIEKQTVKKSPMAEIVGIPGLGERRRKKLGLRKLQDMNLAQIQVLYNDLQTQIESLNEDLVQLLMERDELHMEQDSMLVDVEDLTRRAEEIAEKATKTKPKETTTCNSKLKGKLLGR